MVVNKSQDELNFGINTCTNNIINNVYLNNAKQQEDKVRSEIEELQQLEVDQQDDLNDLNLNGQFAAELKELNLTHLNQSFKYSDADLKGCKTGSDELIKEDKQIINSNIKNINAQPNVLDGGNKCEQKPNVEDKAILNNKESAKTTNEFDDSKLTMQKLHTTSTVPTHP